MIFTSAVFKDELNFLLNMKNIIETRTKTSIRYAKENDRERERKVEGEI